MTDKNNIERYIMLAKIYRELYILYKSSIFKLRSEASNILEYCKEEEDKEKRIDELLRKLTNANNPSIHIKTIFNSEDKEMVKLLEHLIEDIDPFYREPANSQDWSIFNR